MIPHNRNDPLTDPSQVEQVQIAKGGTISMGTVHLTAHHIIFHYDAAGEKEMWVSGPPAARERR